MKLVVWYHCVLSGPRLPSEDHALAIYTEQMRALQDSGLAQNAAIHIAVNGGDGDALLAASLAPDNAVLHVNGPQACSEVTTLERLRQSLAPGQFLLYHHIKGVQHPHQPVYERWRHCMERVCVWNWRTCVQALADFETVGPHWMHNSTCNIIPPSQKYWGGNFWWARTDYLLKLPPLGPDTWAARYEAEVWIGKAGRAPKVRDFARHFPMNCPA